MKNYSTDERGNLMAKCSVTKDFSNILNSIAFASVLLKLSAIPLGMIQARLISDIVLSATAGNFNEVLRKGGMVILLIAVFKLFDFFTQNAYQKAKSNKLHKCKLLLYRNYLSSSLSILYRSSAGKAEVIFKSDFNTLTDKITEVGPQTISAFVAAISYFVFICAQSLLVGVILLGISLVQVIPPFIFKRLYSKYDVADKEIEAKSADCALEFYNGFATIKLFNLKKWMLRRLNYLHNKWCGIANRLQATFRSEEAVDSMISNILTYGTYAIVGLLILSGSVKSEAGIQAIALSAGLYIAIKTCFAAITKFSLAKIAESRLAEYWNPSEIDKMVISQDAGIVFSDVSCTLSDKNIFENLDINLPLDGRVILHGENGSGKSTLMKLALGMLEAQSGEIYTGAVAPRCLSYDNYPRKIFFLPQEDALYNLTTSELYSMILKDEEMNVAYLLGKRLEICEDAYSRVISELSGGERKKVFLSLAFAINPDILILDEPTNSLDSTSRHTLCDLLRERTKSVIIITHDEELFPLGTVIYRVQKGGGICAEKCEKTDL